MIARLHLVRHAESRWNVERRYQGQGDSGLTQAGVQQAEQLAEWLVDHLKRPERVVASDLPRAHATAAPFADRIGATIALDSRFREVDVGAWSGRYFVDVAAEEPEVVAAMAAGIDVARGGGETFTAARARVCQALHELVDDLSDDAATIVFTHGGPIRVAVAAALGLPAPGHAGLHPPTNCSISSLERVDGSWRLVQYNRPTVAAPSEEPTE